MTGIRRICSRENQHCRTCSDRAFHCERVKENSIERLYIRWGIILKGWIERVFNDMDGAGRQGVKEGAAVSFGDDAGIEDDDNTAVGLGTDESAEALLEFQNGLGELVIEEGIAAGRFDMFEPSLEERVVGDGKGKFDDDDVAEVFAGDIDALPKAVGAEQHALRILTKLVEKSRAVVVFALFQQVEIVFGAERTKDLAHLAEMTEICEKDESFAGGLQQIFFNDFSRGDTEILFPVAGFGQVSFNVHGDLVLIVKGGPQLDGVEVFQAQARTEKGKTFIRSGCGLG